MQTEEPSSRRKPNQDHSADGAISRGGRLGSLLSLWFGMKSTVGPADYTKHGFGLMICKYAVEASGVWAITGASYMPWDFLNPLLSARFRMAGGAPEWLGWLWFVWTLPFLWIAITMSVRRCADAGRSPWAGFLVLLPVLNLLFMIGMCRVPTRSGSFWQPVGLAPGHASATDAAMSVGLSLVLGGLMLTFTVYVLESYGASLFLGTPAMMGAITAYLYNRRMPRDYLSSAGLGIVAVALAGLALLLFALEGVICIVMALPVFLPLGAFGAFVGKAIADASRLPQGGLAACVIALPLWAVAEAYWAQSSESVVTTAVVVDASPDVVWESVLRFPDLPPDTDWYFRLGIASPQRARIEGEGIGATRYCEFTTGEFVEPITSWAPPHRLAFDVTDQPSPMFELSPYGDIHPPHLDGFMHSLRGEFVLVGLDDGRTRLEGSTWYEVKMFPEWYWGLWCDSIVHRIHERVLRHIQERSEARGE